MKDFLEIACWCMVALDLVAVVVMAVAIRNAQEMDDEEDGR